MDYGYIFLEFRKMSSWYYYARNEQHKITMEDKLEKIISASETLIDWVVKIFQRGTSWTVKIKRIWHIEFYALINEHWIGDYTHCTIEVSIISTYYTDSLVYHAKIYYICITIMIFAY